MSCFPRRHHLGLLAAVVIGWLPGSTLAGDLYKWQDEDGIWHFSDRPPQDGVEAEVSVFERDPVDPVSLRSIGTKQNPSYEVFNGLHGPIELRLRMSGSRNVTSDPPLPASIVLQGQERRRVVSMSAADPGDGFEFNLSYDWTPGPPLESAPDNASLPLPLAAGQTYLISQGAGSTTHNDDENQYAMDISLPEGTPILAVADGLVMEAEDGFTGGGTEDDKYIHRANRVRLMHDDGRMTVYAHLQPGSIGIRPGNRVRRGDVIGRSGNTGFSTGPHLHFVWQQNIGGALMSLPFLLIQPGGAEVTPAQGLEVRGTLSGPTNQE